MKRRALLLGIGALAATRHAWPQVPQPRNDGFGLWQMFRGQMGVAA